MTFEEWWAKNNEIHSDRLAKNTYGKIIEAAEGLAKKYAQAAWTAGIKEGLKDCPAPYTSGPRDIFKEP